MSDPIRDLADRLARVERELHALSTAPRANITSIQNGYMRVLTSNGDLPAIAIGSTVVDGDDVAIFVTNEDGPFADVYLGTVEGRGRLDAYNTDKSGLVIRVDDGHLTAPQLSCAWQRWVGSAMDGNGMSTTNTASYVDMWHSVLPLGTDQINAVIDVIPDGGVTADIRVIGVALDGVHDGTPAAAQTIVSQTGINTNVVVQGPWTVPDAIWTPASDPAGTLLWLTIQGRVTAGGPSVVHVAPRLPVWVV